MKGFLRVLKIRHATLALITACVFLSGLTCAAATELGIEGTRFTLNHRPVFLMGISYYGALGATPENIRLDLDEMKRIGFNWIRVWATWAGFENNVSAVEGDGSPREPYLSNLKVLIQECDTRGMVVDVTLSRGNGVTGPSRLQSLDDLIHAAETLASQLQAYRNWYLDMGNERNINDFRFVSIQELHAIARHVKERDPRRLVTASNAGVMDKETLRAYLVEIPVDFVAIHLSRNEKSSSHTAPQIVQLLDSMKALGKSVPVHCQEPFRRGYQPGHFEPTAEDFIQDLQGAMQGGAAGWSFHNGDQKNQPESRPRRSFDLRDSRLFDQLDSEEKAFLERLPALLKSDREK